MGGVGGGGAIGATGAAGADGALCSIIDCGARPRLLNQTSERLVTMKSTARMAVVRVSRFAVERPVINPDIPPPPMPSAPPSLFCSRTTPTRAIATRIWTTRSRTIMERFYLLFGRLARGVSRAGSAAAAGDRPETIGVEACSADQRAIDLGQAKDARGVLRIDRAAVENPRARRNARTNCGVHCRDVFQGRGKPGADRPDRLIGDDEVIASGAVRDRSGELGRDDIGGVSRLALQLRLPDAKDRDQAR